MPKFFIKPESVAGDTVILRGEKARHIVKSLRMREGESVTFCRGDSVDLECRITRITPDGVEAVITGEIPTLSEPSVDMTLFVALSKSDKLEFVVMKATELGVNRIVVFKSSRCVPDPDCFEKRAARLGRIALEAAEQSRRGRVPEVCGLYSFTETLDAAAQCDIPLFLYESGGEPLRSLLLDEGCHTVSAIIGPEGGFTPEELNRAKDAGIKIANLGKRILRCETAAIAAAVCVMFSAGEY